VVAAGREQADLVKLIDRPGVGKLALDHVGQVDTGNRIRRAIDRTLCDDRVRTGDLGGTATTRELADAIILRLA
jgi:isocitrate dehydrogenase (NAD+)